jgi:hypothetical protein
MTTDSRSSGFRELALIAAQTAALECADDRHEFGRIQRAVLTAMEQAFPEACDFSKKEKQA